MRAQVRRNATRAGVTLAIASLGVTAFGPAAAAATGDVSRGEAQFLSGTFAGQPFSTVGEIKPAVAERKDDEPKVVTANDLSGAVLGQALPEQSGGLTVPLSQLITFGAAAQYAEASPRAAARAASGAVSDSGVVNTAKNDEVPANVTFSLASVLAANGVPAGAAEQVDLAHEVGGLAAVAAGDAESGGGLATTCGDLSDPKQCRDYDLATAKATLKIAALGDVLGPITEGIETGTVPTTSCTTLSGSLPPDPTGVLGQIEAGCEELTQAAQDAPIQVRPKGGDLQGILDDVTEGIGGDGVSIDATSGEVTIDLAVLVEKATGRAINDLPPNTDIAPFLADALANLPNVLSEALSEGLGKVGERIRTSGFEVIVAGQPPVDVSFDSVPAEFGDAADALLEQVQQGIEDGGQQLADAFAPLADQADAFAQIGSLVVNVQEEPEAGVFREVALRGTLLPGTPAEAVLDLASATVSGAVGGEQPGGAVPADPVDNPTGPGLPNTGAGTLDLPFLLLGFAFVTGGLWIVMWGRAPVAQGAPAGPRDRRA